MTTGECGTCKFYSPALDDNGVPDLSRGVCRFMPPQPILVNRQTQGTVLHWEYPILPRTNPNCAQWTLRKGATV